MDQTSVSGKHSESNRSASLLHPPPFHCHFLTTVTLVLIALSAVVEVALPNALPFDGQKITSSPILFPFITLYVNHHSKVCRSASWHHTAFLLGFAQEEYPFLINNPRPVNFFGESSYRRPGHWRWKGSVRSKEEAGRSPIKYGFREAAGTTRAGTWFFRMRWTLAKRNVHRVFQEIVTFVRGVPVLKYKVKIIVTTSLIGKVSGNLPVSSKGQGDSFDNS